MVASFLRKYLFLFLLTSSSFIHAETPFFIKNKGQVKGLKKEISKDLFAVFKSKMYDVYFFKDKISYVLKKTDHKRIKFSFINGLEKEKSQLSTYRVDMEFINLKNKRFPKLKQPKAILKNYISALNTTITITKGFQELIYEDIYEGVDLVFYVRGETLKYDFVVHQEGNYKNIQYKYVGAGRINNQKSKLIIETPLGNLTEALPEIYQKNKNGKSIIKGAYKVTQNIISFQVSGFDNTKDLVIDPWSTFVGGSDIDECYSTFIDSKKNTYISGYTGSANFPTTVGALETVKEGLYDAFITKLDTTGNILWSTYYGGQGDEFGYEVLVDSDDNPYLIGHTTGNDILVSANAFQTSSNGSYDAFILKLDTAGNFIWGTYFGGSGGELTLAAAIDNADNIVIGGYSSSTDMPLLNPFQNNMAGALDAFVAKFDSSGALLWSTYCGGADSEDVHVIATDNQNNVLIAGETFSSNFPTSTGAFQSNNNGGLDIYLVKYDANGNRIFSTYFGGTNTEDALGLATDNSQNIYLAGYTASIDFPMLGSNIYQASKGAGRDAFVAKFTPFGIPYQSTFIGGSGDERFTGATISSNNALYLSGYTSSTDLPLLGTPYQTVNNGLTDGMYFRMDTALTPTYSTYIGGVSADYIYDLKIDGNQQLTFVGFTSSSDFPITSGVAQEIISGQSDAFVFQSDSIFNVITNLPNTFKSKNLIQVFPNPTLSSFSLNFGDFNAEDNFKLIVYTLEGKVVLQQKIHQKNTIIKWGTGISQGNYILVLLKENEIVQTTKIIKAVD